VLSINGAKQLPNISAVFYCQSVQVELQRPTQN